MASQENLDEPVLEAIREKELELKALLLEVKRQAEEMLTQARSTAASIKEEAREKEYKKGQIAFKRGTDRAKKKAAELELSAEQELKQIEERGKKNFEEAVNLVLRAILGSRVLTSKKKKEIGHVS